MFEKKGIGSGIFVTGLGVSILVAMLSRQGAPLVQQGPPLQPSTPLPIIVLPTPTPKPPRATLAVVTATPTATPTVDLYGTAPCGCSYDAYNCEDFRDALGAVSVEGAQLCFNYCLAKTGADVHGLIRDVPWDAYINTAWVCTNGEIKFESEGLP